MIVRLQMRLRAIVIAAALLALPTGALAQSDFFSSSPGDLSRSHASIDGSDNCNECHDGGKATNDRKCLGCHDHQNLKKRIDSGLGFHASAKVRGKKCETCHLEHKGRSFNIMGWDAMPGGEKGFDHGLTGWKLRGKHAATDCADCHKETNKQGLRLYLGETQFCGSSGCHKSEQPHEFDRQKNFACDRCHSENTWKPGLKNMDFDHDDPNDAAMPLEGTHADVNCEKCHPKDVFNLKERVPDDCANCHESPHKGHLFGLKDCDWCHSPKFRSLEKFSFNHRQRTRFELGGAHAKLDCYECHTAEQGARKPSRQCETCHADDHPHGTRFAAFGKPLPKCGTCHPSSGWTAERFNHNKKTRFKLTAKHAQTDCRGCHRGATPDKFERLPWKKQAFCRDCHAHENVHDGEFVNRECERCHTTPGNVILGKDAVDFYHGPQSDFPLRWGHKDVDCVACHINETYVNTPAECGVRCHQDSLHRGSLGDACSRCHDAGRWETPDFDHTEQTDWPLDGWHRSVPNCEDCHPGRQYADTPTNCGATGCHAADDVHQGALGNACEDCHLETGQNIFDHNTQSNYILDGAHLETTCVECHPSIEFKPRPTDCFGCHPEPESHKGQYGTICEDCHSTTSFLDIVPLHDVGNFSLAGAHNDVTCKKCHLDSRQLAGTGELCVTCHRQDDIHSNSLSPRCGECHTQWSFAPARFDHTTVGCNLTGLHKVVSCYECHANGNFGGLVSECYSCHRDTAAQVVAPPHNNAAFFNCGSCHNPNSWLPGGAGIGGFGQQSICR